ncbi:hypothetical protein ACFSCZ_19305 [Siminovitchia sediminis]|uniref:Cucumopine synthase C-terminal helical bundle domain-containing protein n=1 Tax=Siminovitchia sediminis TaxID=1274353 RepID=A0ABW4KN76_9BACI
MSKVTRFIEAVEKETENIWLNEPEDIHLLKKGVLLSGAGIYDQYYSVLVMLGGEMRALGIHIFADLLEFSKEPAFDAAMLKKMAKRMLKIDVGVISYFGLFHYGKFLEELYEVLEDVTTKEEFTHLTQAMFTFTNRYQLWMHQIFPWSVSVFFKQQTPENLEEMRDRLNRVNK